MCCGDWGAVQATPHPVPAGRPRPALPPLPAASAPAPVGLSPAAADQAEASLLPPNVCPLLQMTPGPGVRHIQQSLPASLAKASLAKAARPAPQWGGQTPGGLPSQLWDGALAGQPASEGHLWLVGSVSLVPSRWAQLCPPPRLPT